MYSKISLFWHTYALTLLAGSIKNFGGLMKDQQRSGHSGIDTVQDGQALLRGVSHHVNEAVIDLKAGKA